MLWLPWRGATRGRVRVAGARSFRLLRPTTMVEIKMPRPALIRLGRTVHHGDLHTKTWPRSQAILLMTQRSRAPVQQQSAGFPPSPILLFVWPATRGFSDRPQAISGGAAAHALRGSLRAILQRVQLVGEVDAGPGAVQDSLIRRINSLMARFNSLVGQYEFPVPMRRELDRKVLNDRLDSEPTAVLRGPDEQKSLYVPG